MTLRISRFVGVAALLALALPAFAQSPVGQWRTFEDGNAKSIVEISESRGVLTGRIIRLLPEGRTCGNCVDRYPNDGPVASMRGRQLKGSNLRDLVILSGFSDPDGDGKYTGGSAFKPDEGKNYSGWMQVQSDGRLRLTGGYKILGRVIGKTQYWERVR